MGWWQVVGAMVATMTVVCRRGLLLLLATWEYLRKLFGEHAYARYCAFVLARGGQPMTAQEFYLWRERHKYSHPAHCC